MNYRNLFLISLLGLLACTTDSNDPESVVREWQSHIDNNRFVEAKALSTDKTTEIIEMMEMILQEFNDSTILHTEFLELSCREEGDWAICPYLLKEEGEMIRDSFLLAKQNGKWLVDIPDESLFDPSELEDIFQEIQ